ncbi:acyltransferase family protein [Legionella longbeachae]|uniref:Putative acyltranferase n=1 Tax=Legionella longbeachae serogroup 1 (strain NSW150) TaxID=661367 RepID=D3HT01_LEGLN|nr:acyltransferase [Legionella longbeachae]VEE02532.1 acyltransferase [Legionella oakridgensis]HBD7398792.1 acyltransferase [Legionella pneumophila]ARB91197.1 acyltransferase [Legionella longbeachae]EEZ94827.1 putative acyltransferase [Legionella longbeachae D-4968]QIN32377.1 acyltransferase family protein [Legionella longbeachae]
MQENIQCENKIEFVNTLRGIAALFVVLSHYFSTFWYKRDTIAHLINAPMLDPQNFNSPIYILWLNKFSLFDWGSYGVGLFFLISGFVIPFSLQRTSMLGFLGSRFLRIIPTYVFGFSISLVALILGTKYFLISWPYSQQEIVIHYFPGIRDILESKNIDSIIWTLEIEMKFYLLVALLGFWFRNYSIKVFFIPIMFFLLNCYLSYMLPEWSISNFNAFIWSRIFILPSQYIIFMFLGVVFHYLYCHKLEPDHGYFTTGFLFLLFCITWWAGPYAESLILAWSYALALLTFMFAYTFPHFFKTNRLVKFLADISYPLYIIHCIGGYVFLRILLDKGFNTGVSLILVSAVAIIVSWLVHLFIEKPSQILGRKFAAKRNLNARIFNLFTSKKAKPFKLNQFQ